jgi:hypothetical protein
MFLCSTFQDDLTEIDLNSLAKKVLIGYSIPIVQINTAQSIIGNLLATSRD